MESNEAFRSLLKIAKQNNFNKLEDHLSKSEPIKIRILSTSSKISNLELSLIEGKNREIRRIMEYFETPVIELKRISYGPYGLNEMKPSEFHKANLNYIDY